MKHVLIVGGGLAGCTAALELSNRNVQVTLIEKEENIGGKVRNYGCKADSRCNNCGLCLAGNLWNNVENNERIRIVTNSTLLDVFGEKGNFQAIIRTKNGNEVLSGIASIILSVGFDEFTSISYGNLELSSQENIINGRELEYILSKRAKYSLFQNQPSSVAFIQCFGSRDMKEKAPYCSRVCCAYSTRAAKALKNYYPDVRIVFFYMDLQRVEENEYFRTLNQENMEFIRYRPVKLEAGNPVRIFYKDDVSEEIKEMQFDLVVLSEGIHPPKDADRLAEICGLAVDKHGFLKYVREGNLSGIYLAGCASGPKNIEEVYSEALTVAREVLEVI